jgi:hypothetical protein
MVGEHRQRRPGFVMSADCRNYAGLPGSGGMCGETRAPREGSGLLRERAFLLEDYRTTDLDAAPSGAWPLPLTAGPVSGWLQDAHGRYPRKSITDRVRGNTLMG